MNKSSLFLAIMAGGSGTRFWPKSTSQNPKQFLNFGSSKSLIEQTLDRFEGLVDTQRQYVLTTTLLKDKVKEILGSQAQVLAEPEARNTAPCIFWAANEFLKIDKNALMLVMPSDHFIRNTLNYRSTLESAISWAYNEKRLVTLGVIPTHPETGFGYIQTGQKNSAGGFQVNQFFEKPNFEKAKSYVEDGNFLWNAGMFIWRADIILEEFKKWMPDLVESYERSNENIVSAYPNMTATSIDYGVLEKSKIVDTFPLDCGWDDLGSWTALENLKDELKIQNDCGVLSAGETVGIESNNLIIDAPGKVVATLGVDNLIVVSHGDTIMIVDRSRAQDIKKLVEKTKITHPKLT